MFPSSFLSFISFKLINDKWNYSFASDVDTGLIHRAQILLISTTREVENLLFLLSFIAEITFLASLYNKSTITSTTISTDITFSLTFTNIKH